MRYNAKKRQYAVHKAAFEGEGIYTKKIKLTAGQMIALGFLSIILIGSVLLFLPISHEEGKGIGYIDALFMSTSAVCVTGLVPADPGSTLSLFGETVICILIQIGGLGITTFGLGLLLFMRKKAGVKEMSIAKESFNSQTFKGVMPLIRTVLLTTLLIEFVGAVLCAPVFISEYGVAGGIGYSVFHSVASFNNAGFDVFGNGNSMYAYIDHTYLNVVTALLVILGGLGFFVMSELVMKRNPRRFSLQTKVVVSMTVALIVIGTVFYKLAEGAEMSWLAAFFTSVSTRTAGFATYQCAEFSNASIILTCVLMVIGASPGSTGGGIKTTTAFVLTRHLWSYSRGREAQAFKRRIPREAIKKALAILMLAVCSICTVCLILCMLEPCIPIRDVFFEVCSAFGTAGLSTGITGGLCDISKFILIFTMFVGRLGPLTIATLWASRKEESFTRAEETIAIG